VVKDPEFNVTCDKLTAFLKHGDDKAAAEPVRKPANGRNGDVAPPKRGGGGLDRAIAEGNVFITQENMAADGTVTKSIGRAKRADYDARTGDIVLTGKPAVRQGLNTCVATAEETVMTLNRDRDMRVVGPHQLIITDKGDLESKP
jgi:lipopolysaccharide export system protein LptA